MKYVVYMGSAWLSDDYTSLKEAMDFCDYANDLNNLYDDPELEYHVVIKEVA